MDSDELKRKLLEAKKDKAIEITILVCEKEHLSIPKINFKGCPLETQDQLAHYHPDLNKICISKTQLHKLKTLRDVENTMYHELAHIIEQNHGGEFVKTKNKFRLDTWRPPSGVLYVRGGQNIETPKQEKETIDKVYCNYHLCRKKRKLSQCPHCKRYFCKEHIRPIVPGRSNIKVDYNIDYHPCSPYYDYDKKQREIEHKQYREALDALKYGDYNFKFEDNFAEKRQEKTKNEKFEKDYHNFRKRLEESSRQKEIDASRAKIGEYKPPKYESKIKIIKVKDKTFWQRLKDVLGIAG